MTAISETLAELRADLHRANDVTTLLLRELYWDAGNERAALAVDTARNKIADALHDLQRCDHA